MKTKEQTLPKWFEGQLYKEGDIVTNRYSGQSIKITAEELSMYDFVMGSTLIMETGGGNKEILSNLRKGLNWFRKNNPEAYMVLLD